MRCSIEEELSVKYSQRAVELEIERIYAFGEA